MRVLIASGCRIPLQLLAKVARRGLANCQRAGSFSCRFPDFDFVKIVVAVLSDSSRAQIQNFGMHLIFLSGQ